MDKKAIRSRAEKLLTELEEMLREQVLTDVRGALGTKPKKTNGHRRDMTCISPGCKNKSRGPRFRYLCEKHQGASDKQIGEWRKARTSK